MTASTGITRVDPVYLARTGRAVVLSDRASWAAAVTGRIGSPDPLLYAGLLGPGYPLGAVTPFAGVQALAPGASGRATGGVFRQARLAAAERTRRRRLGRRPAAGRRAGRGGHPAAGRGPAGGARA